MNPKIILNQTQINLIIQRLIAQIMERHPNYQNLVLIGLQPRGSIFARQLHQALQAKVGYSFPYGELDVTFHRDDFRQHSGGLIPAKTDISFLIEEKKVILIDDVLFTGRTIRSGLDALIDFGRPESVELLVLIDRNKSRQFPIEADYCGLKVDTVRSQKVKVVWQPHSEVHIFNPELDA